MKQYLPFIFSALFFMVYQVVIYSIGIDTNAFSLSRAAGAALSTVAGYLVGKLISSRWPAKRE